MKKKVIIILLTILIIISICTIAFFILKNKKISDSLKFKIEYELLNDKKDSDGNEYRKISIDRENPYIYSNAEEIISKIENKETFYIYFGDSKCPWCRSVIEKSIECAEKNNISKIYYIDIWNDEHNEILRDEYELDSNNNLVKVNEGTETYYKLLKYLGNVLNDYVLTDKDGNKISVGEKRIYAPNYIYVKNGVAIKSTEGISELQADSQSELTEEILKDQEKQFEELFFNNSYCDDKC